MMIIMVININIMMIDDDDEEKDEYAGDITNFIIILMTMKNM
jgi:hypothetical protein